MHSTALVWFIWTTGPITWHGVLFIKIFNDFGRIIKKKTIPAMFEISYCEPALRLHVAKPVTLNAATKA